MLRSVKKKNQLKMFQKMIESKVVQKDVWYLFSTWVCKRKDGFYYFDAPALTQYVVPMIESEDGYGE